MWEGSATSRSGICQYVKNSGTVSERYSGIRYLVKSITLQVVPWVIES